MLPLSTPPNVFDKFVLHREQLVQQQSLECHRQRAVAQQEIDISRTELKSFVRKVHDTMTTDAPVVEQSTVDSSHRDQSLLDCVRTAISALDEQIDKQRRSLIDLAS